jgi:hypothetical protein
MGARWLGRVWALEMLGVQRSSGQPLSLKTIFGGQQPNEKLWSMLAGAFDFTGYTGTVTGRGWRACCVQRSSALHAASRLLTVGPAAPMRIKGRFGYGSDVIALFGTPTFLRRTMNSYLVDSRGGVAITSRPTYQPQCRSLDRYHRPREPGEWTRVFGKLMTMSCSADNKSCRDLCPTGFLQLFRRSLTQCHSRGGQK